MIYVWSAGYKTKEAAESAWLSALEEGQASHCEFHRIRSYRFDPDKPRRWLIELKH